MMPSAAHRSRVAAKWIASAGISSMLGWIWTPATLIQRVAPSIDTPNWLVASNTSPGTTAATRCAPRPARAAIVNIPTSATPITSAAALIAR